MVHVEIEDFHASIAGGKVFVRHWHAFDCGARTPLILLHDSLGCVELWRDFPQQLAQRLQRPVLAYDRLGFGRSSRRTTIPGPDFIDEEAARDFPALRAALGIDRYVLFGHSVGGGMALAIAAADEDCLAVVSESAQAFVEPRTLDGIRQAQAAFADPVRFGKLERVHGDKARWVLDAWIESWLHPDFAAWSLRAVLPQVTCPSLVIHGVDDEYGSPAHPQLITELSAGPARLELMADTCHVPHREREADVVAMVRSFVAT